MLCHSEQTGDRQHNTNNLYGHSTTFKVVRDAVYRLLPTVRKVANTCSTSQHTNLCHLVPNIPDKDRQCDDADPRNACSLQCHPMVTFTGTCHVFSNVYATLPKLPYCSSREGKKKTKEKEKKRKEREEN